MDFCFWAEVKDETELELRYREIVEGLTSSEWRQPFGGFDFEHDGSIDNHVEPLARDRLAFVKDVGPKLTLD
jgi:hypothetical protein